MGARRKLQVYILKIMSCLYTNSLPRRYKWPTVAAKDTASSSGVTYSTLPFFASGGRDFRFLDYFRLVARYIVHACLWRSYTMSLAKITAWSGWYSSCSQYDGLMGMMFRRNTSTYSVQIEIWKLYLGYVNMIEIPNHGE